MDKKYKIAIVDDEPQILSILERFLSNRDQFMITTYLRAKDALKDIQSGAYDMVLLDIMMPEINGIELFKLIKESNPNQRVIMMTASSTQSRLIECDQAGVSDYITKPFLSLRDVENLILDCLE